MTAMYGKYFFLSSQVQSSERDELRNEIRLRGGIINDALNNAIDFVVGDLSGREIGRLKKISYRAVSTDELRIIIRETPTVRSLAGPHISYLEKEYVYKNLTQALCNPGMVYRFYTRDSELRSLTPEIGKLYNLRECTFYSNRLQKLPREIGLLYNLQTLSVYYNSLRSIPAEIGFLCNLRKLQLEHNKIRVIPPEIGNLENLRHLLLADNPIEQLPRELGQLHRLKTLSLSLDACPEIPREIALLQNLRELTLQGKNPVHSAALAEIILQMPNLRSLTLNGATLVIQPEHLAQFRQLRSLTITGSTLSVLPLELCSMDNLRRLVLEQNTITTLPEEIHRLHRIKTFVFCGYKEIQTAQALDILKGLPQLQNLEISNRKYSVIPKEIGQLANLRSLTIYGLQNKSFPREIGQLINLRSLTATNDKDEFLVNRTGKFSKLPREIGQLTKLRYLMLDECKNLKLPPEIGQLKNLKTLILRHTVATSFTISFGPVAKPRPVPTLELPPEFGQLSKLQHLEISYWDNLILPDEIILLNKLRVLKLDRSSIFQLPEKSGLPRNIRQLSLNWESDMDLPPTIGELHELRSFEVEFWSKNSEKSIYTLPETFWRLKNLKHLSIKSTRDFFIPPEVQNLRNLRSLNLTESRVQAFPAELGLLRQLRSFSFKAQDNQEMYKNLYSILATMPWLITISINFYSSNSFIMAFPEEILRLQHIEVMDFGYRMEFEIRHNKLRLPERYRVLSHLLPPEIFETLRDEKPINFEGSIENIHPDTISLITISLSCLEAEKEYSEQDDTSYRIMLNTASYVVNWQVPEQWHDFFHAIQQKGNGVLLDEDPEKITIQNDDFEPESSESYDIQYFGKYKNERWYDDTPNNTEVIRIWNVEWMDTVDLTLKTGQKAVGVPLTSLIKMLLWFPEFRFYETIKFE